MHDGYPAIALLGPHTLSDPNTQSVARDVGRAVVRQGYDLLLLGGGATSHAGGAGAAGTNGTGRVISIMYNGETPLTGGHVEQQAVDDAHDGREAIVAMADALVVLPGDVDALAIVLQIWAWGHEPAADYRQMILVGEAWPEIVRGLAAAAGMGRRSEAMVTFAGSAEEAVETIRYYVAGRA